MTGTPEDLFLKSKHPTDIPCDTFNHLMNEKIHGKEKLLLIKCNVIKWICILLSRTESTSIKIIIVGLFIVYLLCARYFAKCFARIVSPSPHNPPEWKPLLPPM